jgi:hypothetical protein
VRRLLLVAVAFGAAVAVPSVACAVTVPAAFAEPCGAGQPTAERELLVRSR